MKRLFQAVRLTAVTLAIAAGTSGMAFAQQGGTGTGGGTTGGGTGTGGTTQDTRSDQGFDLGWLGLIGLAGLIPLFVRRNGHTNTHSTTGTRGAGAH